MVGLIILDVYGTLIKADKADDVIRPGLEEFLEYYKKSSIVVFSDGEIAAVEFDLSQAGLNGRFVKIYGSEHLDERKLKNLELITTELSIPKNKTRFIGDNAGNKDYCSAKRYGIPFIKIPQFRERIPSSEEPVYDKHVKYETKPFTFVSLMGRL